jgi:hypothetical protein
MTSPKQRKANSERILEARGILINPHLPLVEAEDDVTLRTSEEVRHRLIALWAAAGTASVPGNDHFRNYIVHNGYEDWLSPNERAFIFSDNRNEHAGIQFSWRTECIYFLSWCGGLVDSVEIPDELHSIDTVAHFYPVHMEPPDVMERAIAIRRKSDILDWADLLYRLHWAVREHQLTGLPIPELEAGVIQEWHKAANWMVRYCEEDWDDVTTDT